MVGVIGEEVMKGEEAMKGEEVMKISEEAVRTKLIGESPPA